MDFWQTSFKVQLEARSGLLNIHQEDRPTKKKRLSPILEDEGRLDDALMNGDWVDFGGGGDEGMGQMDINEFPQSHRSDNANQFGNGSGHRQSSEVCLIYLTDM